MSGEPNYEEINGYRVSCSVLNDCVGEVFTDILTQNETGATSKWLACFNPHSYAVAEGDIIFQRALEDADWLVPDGAGVLVASFLLGGNIRSRVTGFEFFVSLMSLLNLQGGMRVFFLGSSDENLDKIFSRCSEDFPNVQVVGSYSPEYASEFSAAENQKIIDRINSARPHVLWVGLTAPKQEKWIFENRGGLNVNFVAGIGAVFDFYSGTIKRSPRAFQLVGLEWLPRLLQEPKRLWRRTFVSAPRFFIDVVRSIVKKG